MAVDPSFIVNLHGKQFILVAGLLDAGHKSGLIGIETEVMRDLCIPEKQFWVVRAIGRFRSAENGEAIWSALGDADPTTSQMRGAYLRHAETRAIARMLRFATNIAMTAAEELGGEEDSPIRPAARVPQVATANGPMVAAPPRKEAPVTRPVETDEARNAAAWEGPSDKCSYPQCGVSITHNNEVMSLAKFKRPLCLEHMKELATRTQAV